MNNIHEKDWASENWGGHSGMASQSEYSIVDDSAEERAKTKLKSEKDRSKE
ncbi:hypothetical protein QA601_07550 [Chitinispirillales bacterium ANBcel5]|uniref:hypothetical protein n=1 Tax=Cellulosispirillum alkaliphilum TaxID=3039283 RepID=UPI002A4EF87C|nr:hypothetical protein [Chitinispirillales bacterium ANBcel5]